MNAHFIKFLKNNLYLSILLLLILFSAMKFLPVLKLNNRHFFIILFFFVFSLIVHYFILKTAEKKAKMFISYFMGSTLVKLILYCSIIITYILNFKEDAKTFTVVFLVSYLIYTMFEVISLQKFMRKK